MNLPSKIAFVDIETTGCSKDDRIIDIGIIQVENNQVTKTFHSLINPDRFIPIEITRITQITPEAVENAPSFYQVKDTVYDLLKDSLFIAHNVNFDYFYILKEFERLDIYLESPKLCTVKLSRSLFPQFKHHNLDSLIERYGFVCNARHRALSDAQVLWQFYEMLVQNYPVEELLDKINKQLKSDLLT